MKNVLVCKNCHEENPYHNLTCQKCNGFLRPRISNIDLWHTIWDIFEAPVKTAENIIHSDHKNFLVLLLCLCCLKFSIVKSMVFNSLKGKGVVIDSFISSIANGGIVFVIFVIGFAFLMTKLNKFLGVQTRFKDNLSIYTYSFIPLLLGMVVLIPINFALFGEYWFTFNPSPFIIKQTAAITLVVIDAILFSWSIGIIMFSTYAQTRNNIYSFFSGLIMLILTIISVYFVPVMI
jgi:hypothetical protein